MQRWPAPLQALQHTLCYVTRFYRLIAISFALNESDVVWFRNWTTHQHQQLKWGEQTIQEVHINEHGSIDECSDCVKYIVMIFFLTWNSITRRTTIYEDRIHCFQISLSSWRDCILSKRIAHFSVLILTPPAIFVLLYKSILLAFCLWFL